jgi:hypothetical protein
MLPKDYKARKALPLYTYLTQYHPDAILELVKVAVAGNEQHNKGEPLHWAQGKSMDQLNTATRHVFDHGQGNVYDTDDIPYLEAAGLPNEPGTMHLAKAAWRLLAEIQLLCDARAMGLRVEEMVRGTHEFRDGMMPESAPPAPEDEKDYPRMGSHVHIAPVGTVAPMEFQDPPPPNAFIPIRLPGESQFPAPTVDIPMPAVQPLRVATTGRILACGCFGSCTGQTPNCPNWIAKTF